MGRSPSPVDGHSLLPGRSLALVVSLLPSLGTGAKQLLPSMAVALSYRWGRGKAPPPSMAIAYYQGDPSRPGSLIITQLRDRCEAAAPVDGHSIIVQMGDGAKLLPRRWPQPTTRAIPRPGSLIITQMGDRCEAAAPVDGHSLLPGRSLALVVSLLPNLGTGTKWLLPSMAVALSYRWGTEQSPVPHLYHKLDYNPETKAMISS